MMIYYLIFQIIIIVIAISMITTIIVIAIALSPDDLNVGLNLNRL